ncbi:MAG: hypothetical protein WDN06_10255 [Asticcacaulis sp.]
MAFMSPALSRLIAAGDLESRVIERLDAFTEVNCPRDMTSAQVEAWLDWADSLPRDLPSGTWARSGDGRYRRLRRRHRRLCPSPRPVGPAPRPFRHTRRSGRFRRSHRSYPPQRPGRPGVGPALRPPRPPDRRRYPARRAGDPAALSRRPRRPANPDPHPARRPFGRFARGHAKAAGRRARRYRRRHRPLRRRTPRQPQKQSGPWRAPPPRPGGWAPATP